ncbi:MAG TPA: sulfite exporter TauE/SafE family protein [Polyangiaceae bacterium]|nr:sulfite exporter TauE/SafE family protein [Polyangiaceae bacterium]
MTPLDLTALLAAVSFFAGLLGSLVGIGGGIVLVPVMTLFFRIDIRYAIGASIVSVIATSSGAAAAYVRERMTNLRVAMFLELGTTAGALSGAFLAGMIQGRYLYLIFGAVLLYSAFAMLRRVRQRRHSRPPAAPSRIADALALHGSYHDQFSGQDVAYRVTNAPLGLALMYLAGIVSGLLGIGSGALKVPAMDLAMHLPIKVSTATSNFMIGVTAAASAGVYFARGDIDPFLAGPVCVGVVSGAFLGSKLLGRLNAAWIRLAFIGVLVWVSVQMLIKGVQ